MGSEKTNNYDMQKYILLSEAKEYFADPDNFSGKLGTDVLAKNGKSGFEGKLTRGEEENIVVHREYLASLIKNGTYKPEEFRVTRDFRAEKSFIANEKKAGREVDEDKVIIHVPVEKYVENFVNLLKHTSNSIIGARSADWQRDDMDLVIDKHPQTTLKTDQKKNPVLTETTARNTNV